MKIISQILPVIGEIYNESSAENRNSNFLEILVVNNPLKGYMLN